MATITIDDLPASRELDVRAMSSIRGAGGAPWVFGAFRAFAPAGGGLAPTVNLFHIDNVIFADQVVNQFQTIDVHNTADNATINVDAAQRALNVSLGH